MQKNATCISLRYSSFQRKGHGGPPEKGYLSLRVRFGRSNSFRLQRMSKMKSGTRIPSPGHKTNDGYRPAVGRPQLITEGYKPNPQGGYVAPTQSAPANPPSGGSSGKPASGSGTKSK